MTNTGDWNTGDRNTGDWNTGDFNTGRWNAGNRNTGNRNTGSRNTGRRNTGGCNTGDRNTGGCNTGDRNTGVCNTGNRNTGSCNTGDCNTGDWNTGHYNTGHYNTGDWNTGHYNTGDWNTGSRNTGDFNTTTPDGGYFFNKWLSFEEWNAAKKPLWLYKTEPTTWVPSEEMTAEEKAEHTDHETTGGYLRRNDMKEEWRKAYESATEDEVQMVRDLPNFDADVFEEITGLDLRKPREESFDGGIVEIAGKKYKLTEV